MTVSIQPWWKTATVYQIYPASFQDSNGDGVGDLPGIQSRLNYIKDLGVDVIWICPMYDSPQVDMGYDISDYESVYPPYGTVQDMENLITACHERGIRVILDLVINHTSNKHKWFLESRSSKDNPKRDWYIWKPAKYDENGNRKPPNNWRSNFGGSVWQWDEHTQEYYLHLFCPEQPDLNWENEETRKALYESAMEFWLRKGVDGFRIDTVNMYSKPPGLEDAPVIDVTTEWQLASSLYCNGPMMHPYLREMNEIFEKYDAMNVGELPNTHDVAHVLRYVSAAEKQLNMVFQFDVVDVGFGKDEKYDTLPGNWKLQDLKDAIWRTQELINGTDAWTTAFMENHDQARSISRFGSDATPELRELSGKMLSILLAALSGTPFVYQGQEIGMTNVPKEWPMDEYKDVESNNYYRFVREKTNDDPEAVQSARKALQHLARDNARVPMQWDATVNAGFTGSAKPWMRVNDNYVDINVKKQQHDSNSVLAFWRQMLRSRKEYSSVLVHGIFRALDYDNERTFTFEKKNGTERAVAVLNFTGAEQQWTVPADFSLERSKLLAHNYSDTSSTTLQPFEGRLYLSQ